MVNKKKTANCNPVNCETGWNSPCVSAFMCVSSVERYQLTGLCMATYPLLIPKSPTNEPLYNTETISEHLKHFLVCSECILWCTRLSIQSLNLHKHFLNNRATYLTDSKGQRTRTGSLTYSKRYIFLKTCPCPIPREIENFISSQLTSCPTNTLLNIMRK